MKIEAIVVKYHHVLEMLQALDLCDGSEWHSEFLDLRPQDIHRMAEVELPSTPTRERAEELWKRTLLNGIVVPEGDQTISWIWRGSLKSNTRAGDCNGQNEFGEGLSLKFIYIHIINDNDQSSNSNGRRLERNWHIGRRR